MATYMDGEVIGLDNDGNVIQWDAKNRLAYNNGGSLEDFGIDNLSKAERKRLFKETED